jgi:hypothetical protein
MIIDLIEVLNKEEDPDLRGPKCNGSFGSGSGTLPEPQYKMDLLPTVYPEGLA